MPDLSKPITLRMAGHELIGVEATEQVLANSGAEWLAVALLAYIEGNNIQTETANLLREWSDRREGQKGAADV